MNLEKLKKDYGWLFKKKKVWVNNGKRQFYTVEFTPIIEEYDSHYKIYREVNSSPLILSKNYG